jgi:phosphoribosyl 1,2-cyclic phosphate phosphodiesterase
LSSGKGILIDCPPDFRFNAIRANITQIDCFLFTHTSPDRLFGLDDGRAFSFKKVVPVYASPAHASDLRSRFPYAFGDEVITQGGLLPKFATMPTDTGFEFESIRIDPIPIISGEKISFGYRIGNFAYLTSGNSLSDESYEKLIGVELVILNASSLQESKTHFSFETACAAVERIQPRKAWFAHISHRVTHAEAEAWIEQARHERPGLSGIEIHAGYDGLKIEGLTV